MLKVSLKGGTQAWCDDRPVYLTLERVTEGPETPSTLPMRTTATYRSSNHTESRNHGSITLQSVSHTRVQQFEVGDRVRIDIPDETDLDYSNFHGEHGTIVSTIQDDLSNLTEEQKDSKIYRVELDSGHTMDFRQHDLRPPLE